jgi:hypothetical protein
VDRDLGTIEMSSEIMSGIWIKVQQQPKDGALYVMRDDGQRRMMIENIFCARKGDWQASVGQVDLAPARAARPSQITYVCAAPYSGGRVACKEPQLWYNIQ